MSCPSTALCDGDDGGVDPPAPSPDGDKCANVACDAGNCPGSCCVKGSKGSCGDPKSLRH